MVRRLVAFVLVWLAPGLASADVSKPHPGLTLVRRTGPDSALTIADLCADGVSVVTTAYAPGAPRSAASWGPLVGAEMAVNGDFFNIPGAYPAPNYTWVIGRARHAGADWPADAQNKEPRSLRSRTCVKEPSS